MKPTSAGPAPTKSCRSVYASEPHPHVRRNQQPDRSRGGGGRVLQLSPRPVDGDFLLPSRLHRDYIASPGAYAVDPALALTTVAWHCVLRCHPQHRRPSSQPRIPTSQSRLAAGSRLRHQPQPGPCRSARHQHRRIRQSRGGGQRTSRLLGEFRPDGQPGSRHPPRSRRCRRRLGGCRSPQGDRRCGDCPIRWNLSAHHRCGKPRLARPRGASPTGRAAAVTGGRCGPAPRCRAAARDPAPGAGRWSAPAVRPPTGRGRRRGSRRRPAGRCVS